MAAMLMPKTIFLAAANAELKGDAQTAAHRLARRFQVSREAAAIRLATFGFTDAESGSQLFA